MMHTAVLQSNVYTVFDVLKFGLAVRLRAHKQMKLNGYVYSFLLFVSSDLGITIKLDFNISKVASSTLSYHYIYATGKLL